MTIGTDSLLHEYDDYEELIDPGNVRAPLFAVEQAAPNSHLITFNDIRAGWSQWVLLSSDRHHDSQQCRQDLEKQHLDQAVERNAVIIDAGDLFDAMQGKDDRRQNKDELRNENKRRDYLDSLITHAAEFYGPYARHFAVIGRGNHESSVIDRHGVDLTSNLVHRLNADHGGNVFAGGYGGWVIFRFCVSTMTSSKALKYFHGAGGGGPVTRGVIQSNRMAVMYPDADIVLSGHTHDQWIVPIKRDRISVRTGLPFQEIAYHIRTPTYKDEYGSGESGWSVERLGPPKPLGAVWLRFVLTDTHTGRIEIEATPAVS